MIQKLGDGVLSIHIYCVLSDLWLLNALFIFLLVHRILPTLMALSFYFAAPTRRFSVFCLTSNMLLKRNSDFLTLGFLTVVCVIIKLGLLSVTSSVVDTIAASRILFRFCWSSNLPAHSFLFIYYSNISVQKKTCCLMIGQ